MTKAADGLSFGPFHLVAGERLLTRGGVPVELGSRALDMLIVLIATPNEVVSKKDLMSRVWPNLLVEEGSLRFHIASLRKALGDGRDGARYITTLPGRGYCFVAPVSRSSDSSLERVAMTASSPFAKLPGQPHGLIGRADDIRTISERLTAARFVTIVGAGGVGKTTVAVAVGHRLIEAFAGNVVFVDFGMLSDPRLVATALASMLGLSVQSEDPTPNLVAYLRDKRILLIFDTCEHLIEAVATMASRVFMAAPHMHILATSRETLQVDGEYVHRLDPLACPPDVPELTAAVAQTFAAVQLFLERAAAGGGRLDLSDTEAVVLAGICRKLDGVPLAIELAARRVEVYGLQQTVTLLDERLALLWSGLRTAPPRQKTLRATLDWSYGLLSELERLVLRRLCVFVGHFAMDAALAVVTSPTVDQTLVFAAIDSLVAKSMVAIRPIGAMMRYRLLDTTRDYVLEASIAAVELDELAVRHARYFQRWLEQTSAEGSSLSAGLERTPHFANLNNVRAALEWCFGKGGNTAVGVGLAAAAAPVLLGMSLLTECHRWSERAINGLGNGMLGGREEMYLQEALGVSLMFTSGMNEAASAALNRSLEIAERLGNVHSQLRLLCSLHMFHARVGDFNTALQHAKRNSALAATLGDPTAVAVSQCVLGMALGHTGDLTGARRELEAALRHGSRSRKAGTTYLGFDLFNLAGISLAVDLWLQGYPDQAVERALSAVVDAAGMEHPATLSVALSWAIPVLLWTGDLDGAEEYAQRLIAHAELHSMKPYLAVGHGFEGVLAIRQGHPAAGVERLESCLERLHAARFEALAMGFNISLGQGLAALGRFTECIDFIDKTIGHVEAHGDISHLPELLRVKGNVFLSMPKPHVADAEACFLRSLELSRRLAARSLELRAATDLAALCACHGRSADAHALLRPIFEQFAEGSGTADLKAAEHLLAGTHETCGLYR
jgi:predicted ATPase/DNA-binding winged helix-turn-helix (wHTH) protein